MKLSWGEGEGEGEGAIPSRNSGIRLKRIRRDSEMDGTDFRMCNIEG